MDPKTTLNNPYIARIAGQASLVMPQMRDNFESCLHAVADFDRMCAAQPDKMSSDDDFWPNSDHWMRQFRPYNVVLGVLQIPVKGALLNNFPFQLGGWATGYAYIQKAFERGLADPEVKGIALIIDSPGGEVAGCFDLVDNMFTRRGEKPVKAFAAESAYSAAYAVASVADKINVSRTGGVGSIGVVTAHMDVSKMMEAAGYKLTFIHAGEHKVDGNPYEPLPDKVKNRIQSRIDSLYGIFTSTVARNRSIDEQAVRDTEALTFTASEALSNGLADSIGTLDDGLDAFASELNNNQQGGTLMSDKNETVAIDQATVDAAKAEGVKTGTVAGATAERARISEIMGSEESSKRQASALNIALKTDMSVEQAKGLLATLPEDAAAAKTESNKELFEAAMSGSGNPELGSQPGATEASASDEIMADYHATVGTAKK